MPGPGGRLKKLYEQLIGGTAPTDAEDVAGSMAAMQKYLINRQFNGTAPGGAASLTGDMSQMMKALVAQILNGTAPAGAASSSGDVAQMIKYIIANSGANAPQRVVKGGSPSGWGAGADADVYTDWLWTPPGFAEWTNAGTPADLAIAAVTADLMSNSDMDNGPSVDLNSSGDMIHSGDGVDDGWGEWKHARAAGIILGAMPDKLELEWIAQFATASANEATSGFGFVQASGLVSTGGAPATKAAIITSNGTNFICTGSAGNDTGAAVDNLWHLWKISMSLADQLVYWYIDGTLQGSFAISTDIFPVRIGAHAFTTNRLRMGAVRVRYAA